MYIVELEGQAKKNAIQQARQHLEAETLALYKAYEEKMKMLADDKHVVDFAAADGLQFDEYGRLQKGLNP